MSINGCVVGEYPLYCSAPGKVLLAYSDEKEIIAVPVCDYTGNDVGSLVNEKLKFIKNIADEISANPGYQIKDGIVYE